jgi:hypothetical protein
MGLLYAKSSGAAKCVVDDTVHLTTQRRPVAGHQAEERLQACGRNLSKCAKKDRLVAVDELRWALVFDSTDPL